MKVARDQPIDTDKRVVKASGGQARRGQGGEKGTFVILSTIKVFFKNESSYYCISV